MESWSNRKTLILGRTDVMGLVTPAFFALLWPRRFELLRQLPLLIVLAVLGLAPYAWMVVRSWQWLPISYNGKNIDINFNAALVLEMLKVLAPDAELHLELVDGNTAALFRSGADYSYVVMPLT